MKVSLNYSRQEFRSEFYHHLIATPDTADFKIKGWCIGPICCARFVPDFSYRNFRGLFHLAAFGILMERKGELCVHYHIFRGTTDPFSLLCFFIGCLAILIAVNAPSPALFSIGITVFVALLSLLLTAASELGKTGVAQLKNFFNSLQS